MKDIHLKPECQLLVVSLEENSRSRTNTFLTDAIGCVFNWKRLNMPGFKSFKSALTSLSKIPRGQRILVTSPNALLVIPLVVLRKGRPVLDMGWPLIDGVVVSRRQFGFLGFKAILTYITDFLAIHLASKVLLETEEQAIFVSKIFFVSRKKLKVIHTGFDERRVKLSPPIQVEKTKKSRVKEIVFRGGNQMEAGLDTLCESLNLLSPSDLFRFKIISKDFTSARFDPSIVKVLDGEMSDEELFRELYSADILLGQMSNHPRLKRTIPHKFFEAAFLRIPYVTSSSGLMNYFVKNEMVFGFEGGNPYSLLGVIRSIVEDQDELDRRCARLYGWYLENASQEVLSNKLLSVLVDR
jgi:hypothetical protein